MTTMPDFALITAMHNQFKPANKGVITDTEANLVHSLLQLGQRTDIELQNCRDMAVMLYEKWAEAARHKSGPAGMLEEMDAMSAVTAVIDKEKGRRGMPI